MNWEKQYQYFDRINFDQVELFATPRETQKVLNTYNHALELLKSGKQAKATSMLKTVADDFPMFSYSSHLYAILLAAKGDFKEANEYFKRVALLDVDEIQAKLLERQLKVIEHEIKLLDQEEVQQKKRKHAYESVKKEISITDILEKAPRKKHLPGATKDEIAEINRQLGNEDTVDLEAEYELEERKANLKFMAVVLAIATITFLIFYFAIRPAILNSLSGSGQAQSRLEWLEQEIDSRAKQGQEEVNKLLEDYNSYNFSDSPETSGE